MYNTKERGFLSRRCFNRMLGTAGLAATVPAFATRAFAAAEDTIRIGFVGPRSGPLGIFGELDGAARAQRGGSGR